MWARIENDHVFEITDIDPSGRFHPSMQWVACDCMASVGDRYVDDSFVSPTVDGSTLERGWRDSQINSTEWLAGRHRDEQDMKMATTLQASQFDELLQYRQALRDWPQSEAFPSAEHRPEPPAWLIDMTP